MDVRTIYNIGDLVWYISDNKVLSSVISGLEISVDNHIDITYTLKDDIRVKEKDLFSFEDEALKNI